MMSDDLTVCNLFTLCHFSYGVHLIRRSWLRESVMVCFFLTLHCIIIPLGWPFSRHLKFFIFPSIFYWQIVAIASAALDEYHKASPTQVSSSRCLFAKPSHHRIWQYILGIFLVAVRNFVPIDSCSLSVFWVLNACFSSLIKVQVTHACSRSSFSVVVFMHISFGHMHILKHIWSCKLGLAQSLFLNYIWSA